MKKTIIAGLSVICAASVRASVPSIEEGSVSIGGKVGSFVEISYVLTGAPGIVTVSLETNTQADASGEWVSIGGKGTGELIGEANRLVLATNVPVKAYWDVKSTMTGYTFDWRNVRATVAAWPTNMPPDYMTVDLRPGREWRFWGRHDGIRWYRTEDDVPFGIGDIRYRTTKLLMRKIPAKNVVWWMGSPERSEVSDWHNVPHKVQFTGDYYAGVFELTVGQLKSAGIFDSLGAGYITDYQGSSEEDVIPAEKIGYYITKLRGAPASYTYAEHGHEVDPQSVIGVLRGQTKIADLDLPTEAEWEYACRAGSATELPCNLEFTEENALLFAVLSGNNHTHQIGTVTKEGPAPVGTLRANDWGLYDIIGNVNEICLDLPVKGNLENYKASLADGWNDSENPAVTVDPAGAASSSVGYRNVVRGTHWCAKWSAALINNRNNSVMNAVYVENLVGLRLFCSVAEAVK